MLEQPTDDHEDRASAEGGLRLADQGMDISRLFARRLRPTVLTVGVLVAVGFPALCLTVQYKDLENMATGYARELAEEYRAFSSRDQTPSRDQAPWRGGAGDYFNAIHGSLPRMQVITICFTDNDERQIGRHDHVDSAAKWWWKPFASGDPVPVEIDGEQVGMLRVDISLRSLHSSILPVLVVSVLIGAAVAWASYHFPVKLARGLEGQVNRLMGEIELKYRASGHEQSNRELQELAYCISHDLQEPLRSIYGYLQLLQRRYTGKLDATADEFITKATAGVIRLRDMIEGILAYSRVQTRGEQFNPVDCAEILQEVIANLNAPIQESGASITWDPLPVVHADWSQVVPLFQNLLSNAIKFRGEKRPEIRVSAKERDGEWVFSFEDNGIGIDPRHKDRIFVLFQRLHGSSVPGDGIGLALCKRIVERHGGRIWVESEPGNGSVFSFTLKSAVHARPKQQGLSTLSL